ncbi:MAG: sulfotransferase domain-containing protein [Candidatus Hodarchaeota archaeon]
MRYDRPLKWYTAFFKDAQSHQLKGEMTHSYLWDKYAAKTIYRFNPNIKILAVLRNPVDQILSRHLHFIQYGGRRQIPLEKSLDLTRCVQLLYYNHLKRYFDLFPRENIKVAFYDDLVKDNISFLKTSQNFYMLNLLFHEP